MKEKSLIEKPQGLLFESSIVNKCTVDRALVVQFIRDLSTLINAAVPLVKSLEVLARQQRDKNFGGVVRSLGESVHSGVAFSVSLMRYPKIFDTFFISMIRAGEVACNLGEVLLRVARHKEKELRLRKRVRSMMIYPMIVMSIAALIVSLLFLFIIPKFESVFSMTLSEGALPLVTRMIIGMSHCFQEVAIFVLIIIVGIVVLFRFIKKGKKDWLIFRLPLVGRVVRGINIALFSRILGTLLSNGVPLIEALKVGENIVTSDVMRGCLKKARSEIENGEGVSEALGNGGHFPEMVLGMICVGEETGTLSNMLLESANKLEEDVELTVEGMMAVLEPAMTVLLAVVIGAIVIALFLPIVNIMNSMTTFS